VEHTGIGKRPKEMEILVSESFGLNLAEDDLTFNIRPAPSLQRKKHIKVKRKSATEGRSNKEQDPATVDGVEASAVDPSDVSLSTGILSMGE